MLIENQIYFEHVHEQLLAKYKRHYQFAPLAWLVVIWWSAILIYDSISEFSPGTLCDALALEYDAIWNSLLSIKCYNFSI